MIYLYTIPDCPMCERAKAFLDAYHVASTTLILGRDFHMDELFRLAPHAKSFPQIFDDELLVGGFDDLSNYDIINHRFFNQTHAHEDH